jgi:putative ABC transport system permease protein
MCAMALLDTVRQDVRAALRALSRAPGFTVAAVLTLALGIGATATIFTVVNAVLLVPLPYAQPERRVALWNRWTGFEKTWLSGAEVRDYRRLSRTLTDVAAWSSDQANLTGGGEPVRVGFAQLTPNTFRVLGAAPLAGRTFADGEDREGLDRVVVISHRLWQAYFGGAPDVVGRTLQLDGVQLTVIGIMPPRFQLPTDFGEDAAEPSALWTPLALDPEEDRGSHGYYGAAVLAPGATAAQASAELRALGAAWTAQGLYPPGDDFQSFVVPLEDEVRGAIRPVLFLLTAAVGCLLLIACANVANLLLVRAEGRQRELAVRVAIGAGPWRVIRQLFTESLVLAVFGSVAGLLLALAATRLIEAIEPASLPRLGAVTVDAKVLAFTAVVGIVTTIVFGLVPVIRAVRVQLVDTLRDGSLASTAGLRPQRTRAVLVITETALAVVLVTGAALMIRSVGALQEVDLGFEPEGVLTMRIALPAATYPEPEQVVAFYERLLGRVRGLPGVSRAGLMRSLPLGATIGDWGLAIEGYTPPYRGANPKGDWQVVSAGALEALGERLVRGRLLTNADDAGAPQVALVNETMARTYWPGQDPIGRRIRQGGPTRPLITVVGVVGDVRHNGLEVAIKEKFYRPHAQFPAVTGFAVRNMNLVVKTAGDPLALAAPIRAGVATLDPTLPVANIRTMADVVASAMSQPRLAGSVLLLFAVLALLLAAIGLYGVLAYVVSERQHEIGIRMAIGADARNVRRSVIRQGLTLAGAGVLAGAAVSVALGQFIRSLLHGVSPYDPATFGGVPALLLAVAFLASWVPARRATRINPIRALKSD